MSVPDRRALLAQAARQALAWPLLFHGLGARAQATRLEPVTLSAVGPGHLLLLPITLNTTWAGRMPLNPDPGHR